MEEENLLISSPKIKDQYSIQSYFLTNKFVEELTPHDFTTKGHLKSKECYFIMFYRPDCKFCKKLKKKWEKLGEIVLFLNVAAFNVALFEDSSAYRYVDKHIEGFPTCIIYKNGKLKEIYNGEPNIEKMLLFLVKKC